MPFGEFAELPIMEIGQVNEFYADTIGVDVIGPNFWTTYYRAHREVGTNELVRVPLVRVGRSLATFDPTWFPDQIVRRQKLIGGH